MKYLITAFALIFFAISCATTKHSDRKISRYEKRVKRLYAHSISAVVVNQKNINVEIQIVDSFPLRTTRSISLNEDAKLGNRFTRKVVYTNPLGKVSEYSSTDTCTDYQLSNGKGGIQGYKGVLDLYFQNEDIIEGVYTYVEIFDMHTASYELQYKFYFDPETMIGLAGMPHNNGYWMNEN